MCLSRLYQSHKPRSSEAQTDDKMSRAAAFPTWWHVCPAKTNISLRCLAIWSESTLCILWVANAWKHLKADSEDSDQPAHLQPECMCTQRRLRSACADAQADLSHRWAHTHSCRKCSVSAQMLIITEVFAAERCYNIRKDEIYYCEWGCCGDGWNKGCCSAAGLIVGLSILGVIIISVIIAVICCFIKHKGKSGRLIGSTTTTTVIGQQSKYM